MLNFILYNNSFEFLLLLFAYINIILTNAADEWNLKLKKSENKLEKFKNFVIIFYIVILFVVSLILIKNKSIYSIIMIIATFYCVYKVFINFTKNKLDLSPGSKHLYIYSTLLFYAFISSNASKTYITSFSSLSHTFKEVLLITYLLIKIILFLFLLLINLSIIILNIKVILKRPLNKLKIVVKKIIEKELSFKLYDFSLYNKYKTTRWLILDGLIFFIMFPLNLVLIILLLLLFGILKCILKLIYNIFMSLSYFDTNRNIAIKQILKISLIIALILVYTIIIYNPNIFSSEIITMYNLISTVILIPMIYDRIKSKKESNS